MLVGFVVLGPVVARPAAAVLGAGAGATRGFTGRLARRNAMRNPRRIAGSAAALMVGTAVVALFTTFGSSVKASIDDMVDDNFGGDLVVAQTDFSGAGIDPATGAGHRRAARGRRLGRVVARHGPDRRRHRSSRWRPTRPRWPRSSTSRTGSGSTGRRRPRRDRRRHPLGRRPRRAARRRAADDVRRRHDDATSRSPTSSSARTSWATSIMTSADWAPHAAARRWTSSCS